MGDNSVAYEIFAVLNNQRNKKILVGGIADPLSIEEIKAILDIYGYRDVDTRIHIAELVLYLDGVWFEPLIEKAKKERERRSQKEITSKGDIDGKTPPRNRRF